MSDPSPPAGSPHEAAPSGPAPSGPAPPAAPPVAPSGPAPSGPAAPPAAPSGPAPSGPAPSGPAPSGPAATPPAATPPAADPADPPADAPPAGGPTLPPRLAEGVEMIGAAAGSGYKEPPALARRGDGQVIQLTPLLYMVAEACDGERDEAAIAEVVTERFGRIVSADNVTTLLNDKLRPLGVLAAPDGSSPEMKKPDPLLALKFRKAIIPERASFRVARLFKPLFFPPVVLAALAGLVVFDSWLFLSHGVAQAFRQSAENPAIMVPVMALVVLAAGWHEFGHAAGCAYGGARPGAMGAGIYLVYPAFYTDVTDSYRLGRAGRLRTDLAGVYFNGLFILAIAGLYAVTGWEALILIIVVSHVDAARQLLPFLRLDGYYIVADLTGVPDLFSRLKPILASSLPWKETDPKVKDLKLWARVVVTVWVVLVIPLLLLQLLMLLLHAPRIIATAWTSLGQKTDGISTALGDGDWLGVASGAFQSAILVLPILGIGLTFVRLGGRGGRGLWRVTKGKPIGRIAGFAGMAAVVGGLAYTWIPNGDYEPIRVGERGTLSEGFEAIAEVPEGRPSLVSEQRAADEGRLEVPPDEEVPVSTTAPTGSTTTTVVDDPDTTPRSTVAPRGGVVTTEAPDEAPPTTEDEAPMRRPRPPSPTCRRPPTRTRPRPRSAHDVRRRREGDARFGKEPAAATEKRTLAATSKMWEAAMQRRRSGSRTPSRWTRRRSGPCTPRACPTSTATCCTGWVVTPDWPRT